jgi:FkbM family methyltransferase
MKLLFIAKQKKNVDTFDTTIVALLARGHTVTLALQERDPERDRRLTERFANERFTLVSCPEQRGDDWRVSAPLVRSARDWAQYYQPPYAQAAKLHRRALTRLLKELGASGGVVDPALMALGPEAGARLRGTLAQIEGTIPSDPLHDEFIARHAPDVVLVTPGLHFGSGQADFIKSARALRIPVWMLLFSWDNLSTKGALHVEPDRLFVWNARQVAEAADLHAYPRERVVVVGAPRFDEFFALRSRVDRESFFAPLGLDVSRRTVLYLCSSRFIAADEATFIRSWLTALRASGAPVLRDCNVIVRPHPDVTFLSGSVPPAEIAWPQMPQATGWLQRPFADDGTVVLRTTYGTPQAFYECLHHADAVVALNTSAELEAGIAGRPVFTVLATGEAADGQAHTLHFDYLLRQHGGFVHYSPDLASHVLELAGALGTPPDTSGIKSFVMAFLRPHGDRDVAPLLADALVDAFTSGASARASAGERRAWDVAQTSLREAQASPVVDELPVVDDGDPARQRLTVGNAASGLTVWATPETRRRRRKGMVQMDPALLHWLDEAVSPGDVLYDIGAGVGTYALVGAVKRGALVVAFEPGYSAFKALCENVRLNACGAQIVPLPIALGDRVGLLELDYPAEPGDSIHVLRSREWRSKRAVLDGRFQQPVCAERLDDVVTRHGLPLPNAIRLSVRRGAESVLAGAARTLWLPSLRGLCVTVKERASAEALRQAVPAACGLSVAEIVETPGFGWAVELQRTAAPATGTPLTRLAGRAAARLRRVW